MSFGMLSDHRLSGTEAIIIQGTVPSLGPDDYKPGCPCDMCDLFRREPNLLSEWLDFLASAHHPKQLVLK